MNLPVVGACRHIGPAIVQCPSGPPDPLLREQDRAAEFDPKLACLPGRAFARFADLAREHRAAWPV